MFDISCRENRILLEIFYEQMDYLTIEQVAATTAGGILGK